MQNLKNTSILLKKLVCSVIIVAIATCMQMQTYAATYTYDANGNQTSDGVQCYIYNDANQLAAVKNCTSGELVAEYIYNAAGTRSIVKNYVAGKLAKTTYSISPNYESVATPGGTLQNTSYYYLNSDKLVAKKNPDGTKNYMHTDLLNSVTAVTNTAGLVVENATYTPYGAKKTGNLGSKYQFTSQQKDQDTGLYFYKSRYYNPKIKRFAQPDSLIAGPYNPQALNRYAYVLNNPQTYDDPSGHCVDGCVGEIMVASVAIMQFVQSPQGQLFIHSVAEKIPQIMRMAPAITSKAMDMINKAETKVGPSNTSKVLDTVDDVAEGVRGKVSQAATEAYKAIGSTGKFGEQMLKQQVGNANVEYQLYKPVEGFSRGRFIDAFDNISNIAHEAKTGYQPLTKTIQSQILKDQALINSQTIESATWHFYKSPATGVGGPSVPLQNELSTAGINYIIYP